MDNALMRDFVELEGLSDKILDDMDNVADDKEDDDPSLRPVLASSLQQSELYTEMEKRGLNRSGFASDVEVLQQAFDEEFQVHREEERIKRRENRRRAAQQAGLQKRRLDMEKALQEEQNELARDHQLAIMIDMIKENRIQGLVRLDVNSVSTRSLAKAIWSNNSVTCLDLSSNNLDDHAGAYLARILKKNMALKKIELDNNELGPVSCSAFGNSLRTNDTLTYLSLDSNPISSNGDNSGVKALAEALRVNKTLTSLNLWRTGINKDAGHMLANAIQDNNTLLFFDIGHNSIDMCDVKRIADKLDANIAAYEARERRRRDEAVTDEERRRRIREKKEAEEKEAELKQWLDDQRKQRAEDRRRKEEEKMLAHIADMQEQKRLADMDRERERKAAEEALAKKLKKKKDKKNKK